MQSAFGQRNPMICQMKPPGVQTQLWKSRSYSLLICSHQSLSKQELGLPFQMVDCLHSVSHVFSHYLPLVISHICIADGPTMSSLRPPQPQETSTSLHLIGLFVIHLFMSRGWTLSLHQRLFD